MLPAQHQTAGRLANEHVAHLAANESMENIGCTFARWPETRLKMNADEALYLLV